MRVTDVDWRAMIKSWPREDVIYVRSICDEVLNQMPRRVTIIRKE